MTKQYNKNNNNKVLFFFQFKKKIETLPHFVIRDYQSKSEIEVRTKLKVTWNLEKKKRITLEEEVDYKIIRSNHIIIS